MKRNLEFYQHFVGSDQHPKFKMLRVKYGWEGEGKFWALNNKIGAANECILNISKKYNKATIAVDLDFSLEQLDEFIEYLHEDCELIIKVNPDEITTETIQENFKKVMNERESSRSRKMKKNSLKKTDSGGNKKSSPEPLKSSCDQNNKAKQSKVKQSKVKQSKKAIPDETGLNDSRSKGYKSKTGNYFKEIKNKCFAIENLPVNGLDPINPHKWVQVQIKEKKHPGAIDRALGRLIDRWDNVDKTRFGFLTYIVGVESGNFTEVDAIQIHEEMKTLEPNKLSELTHGLFKKL